ncbi:protein NETWORKED 4B-like [Zingiber officinale]|nr:protein NETWORKED 4B-like [Zingiber officinale]XP_042399018.1 protein NETWORKED 4B-like [Zingiber officinale]XP_042399019.1 protein NETWORKED 4B-like [Zingiber officinale]XP_042399020.1 protein NETWORKED 4B-like [Zingiber officinale]XP_042399021.1 protein NETWORKED 4B-like [Zingiber officinale]XP_042399022.1 protein NETWORKED 4B-like [Zingiber officinale]
MKRMLSKKSHSLWWDRHISRKNSKWLEENLEKMDRSVTEMLKLTEGGGDSFAKKAEMYYEKRPELISHVEEFHRMYRALAERYDQVTSELRKSIESELKSQGSWNGFNFLSNPPSPLSEPIEELRPELNISPESKLQQPDLIPRAAGFDFFLPSSSSPDLSRKDIYDSFSYSESEPELEEINEESEDDTPLEMREKLQIHEYKSHREDDCSLKIAALELDLSAADEKLHSVETDIWDLKDKLKSTNASLCTKIIEFNLEKEKVSCLEENLIELQEEIFSLTHETVILKGAAISTARQFHSELLNHESIVEDYKNKLSLAEEKFIREKSSLEASIADLEGANKGLKAEVKKASQEKLLLKARISELEHRIHDLEISNSYSVDKMLQEKSELEAEIFTLSQSNSFLEAEVTSLDNEMRELVADKISQHSEKQKLVAALNGSLDALKLKVDMLTTEKEELSSKADSLVDDISSRNDKLLQMKQQMHHLHLERAELFMEIEESNQASSDLKSRVQELEEEVERQKVAISDGEEAKKEAIRQLCVSLEHYRDGYHQLRHLLQENRRSAMAAR